MTRRQAKLPPAKACTSTTAVSALAPPACTIRRSARASRLHKACRPTAGCKAACELRCHLSRQSLLVSLPSSSSSNSSSSSPHTCRCRSEEAAAAHPGPGLLEMHHRVPSAHKERVRVCQRGGRQVLLPGSPAQAGDALCLLQVTLLQRCWSAQADKASWASAVLRAHCWCLELQHTHLAAGSAARCRSPVAVGKSPPKESRSPRGPDRGASWPSA